jgi:hypothetical protein
MNTGTQMWAITPENKNLSHLLYDTMLCEHLNKTLDLVFFCILLCFELSKGQRFHLTQHIKWD